MGVRIELTTSSRGPTSSFQVKTNQRARSPKQRLTFDEKPVCTTVMPRLESDNQ